MDVEVGAFGEILAQRPVGVLVCAALPRGMPITEVDGHFGGHSDLLVLGQLCSLIPGQGFSQTLGQKRVGLLRGSALDL
jgi:hypothetical protein